MDKKNLIIVVLAGLLILGSLWGSVGNKKSKNLRRELVQAEEKLAKVEAISSQAHDAVLTKAAEAQKTLQVKEEQVANARKELVALRKENKGLEAKLSERDATVRKVISEKDKLVAKAQSATVQYVADLQKKLTALKKELHKRDNQLARKQDDIAGLKKKLTALKKEMPNKDEQLAREQTDTAAQEAGDLQKKKITSLLDELSEKKEQLNRERSFATEQVARLEKKIAVFQKELKARDEQVAKMQVDKKQVKGTKAKTGQDVAELHKNLSAAEAENMKLTEALANAGKQQQEQVAIRREFETALAQIIGLEKIVEEKNAVIEETSRTLDRVNINMDVLLNKIADQQDGMQEVEQENRELVKELAVRNKELADLQEKVQAVPDH